MNKDWIPPLNTAVNKLSTMLITKQDELRRRENSQGTYHDVRKMQKLRAEIASLEKRLQQAEWLQERALVS